MQNLGCRSRTAQPRNANHNTTTDPMNLIYKTALLAFATSACTAFADPEQTADSSSATPYVIPVRKNVLTRSILTVGDAVNYKADGATPYRMVGIPDGLGAFDNNDGTFTLLMNHELTAGVGIKRDHGFVGAFISRWIIEKESLT